MISRRAFLLASGVSLAASPVLADGFNSNSAFGDPFSLGKGGFGQKGGGLTIFNAETGNLGELSFERASAGTYFDLSSAFNLASVDEARFESDGLLLEVASTNKSTNYNIAPTDLTNVTKGGAGSGDAVLAVVDDTAALAAAGISGSPSNGMAFELDNTGSAGNSAIQFLGAAGNTNAHSACFYYRGSGSGVIFYNGASGTSLAISPTSAYQLVRQENKTPVTGSFFVAQMSAGGSLTSILNQFEELPYCTSAIPIAGSTASRAADLVTFTPISGPGLLTLVLDAHATAIGTEQTIWHEHDETADESQRLYFDTDGKVGLEVIVGGVTVVDLTSDSAVANRTQTTIQVQRHADNWALKVDSQATEADASGGLPTVTAGDVFRDRSGGTALSGHLALATWTPGGLIPG